MKTSQHLVHLTKFILAGGSVAVFHLIFMYVLTSIFMLWYIASAIVSYSCAIILNYILQKKLVFVDTDSPTHAKGRQFTLFTITALTHLAINTLLLYIFVNTFGVHYLLAQAIILIFLSLGTYCINRYFIFT